MVEQNESQDQWLQMKAKIKKAWTNLSDEELEATRGNFSEISYLILRKSDENKQQVAKRLVDIMHSVDEFEAFKHAQLGIDLDQRL